MERLEGRIEGEMEKLEEDTSRAIESVESALSDHQTALEERLKQMEAAVEEAMSMTEARKAGLASVKASLHQFQEDTSTEISGLKQDLISVKEAAMASREELAVTALEVSSLAHRYVHIW
jgi:chromosome segregation ATPase